MTMTREEMQRLASLGRDGDTMLAHINPEEAALLKSRGGSGTINPNTGLPEFRFGGKLTGGIKSVASIPVSVVTNPVQSVKDVVSPVVEPIKEIVKPIVKTFAEVAGTPEGKLAIAYFMPGFGSSIVSNLGLSSVIQDTAMQKVVGNALAEIAINTASGVPLETAIKNASVNAATSAGTPYASQYVDKIATIPAVSDAIVSAGTSYGATIAKGGTSQDALNNAIGASVASGLTSADVNKSVSIAAGNIAAKKSQEDAIMAALQAEVSAKGKADQAAKTKAETPTTPPTAPSSTPTDLAGSETTTPTPSTPADNELGTVEVKSTSPITTISDVTTPKQPSQPSTLPSLPEVKVTAKKEPITTLSDVSVTGSEEVPAVSTQTSGKAVSPAEKPTSPSQQEAVDRERNILTFSGFYPQSTLGATLKTQAPFYPVAGTTTGLTGERGAGEIESKETGKKRQDVWNEASLRLKDALGV